MDLCSAEVTEQGGREEEEGEEVLLSQPTCLKFITDSRSEKLRHGSIVEVCWYLTETREQYRIAGQVLYITEDTKEDKYVKERVSTWKAVSEAARQSFYWPPPGQPVDIDLPEQFMAEANAELSAPPQTFVVGLVDPVRIDHLQLRGTPQRRKIWTRKEQRAWEDLSVNP
eukprot:761855-Hanusia_phi.AAC.2